MSIINVGAWILRFLAHFGFGMNGRHNNDLVSFNLLHSLRFDTYRSKDESRRLAKYVDGVEAGFILAMVVNDEGSNNLEDSAKKSLSRLGSQHFNSLGFR